MRKISDKTVGKLVSLLTLVIGISVGFAAGCLYRPQQQVQAQAVLSPEPEVKEVSPNMTVGTIGTNLLLAHEVAADRLIVNGFDIMKMQQNILNYLASQPLSERAAIQNIINGSKATTAYRLKVQEPPPTTPPAGVKK